jgi:hypothetical protein
MVFFSPYLCYSYILTYEFIFTYVNFIWFYLMTCITIAFYNICSLPSLCQYLNFDCHVELLHLYIYIYMWLLICNLYYMSNINTSILDNIWYIVYAEPTLLEQDNIFPWTTVLFIIVFLLNQFKMASPDIHIFMELAIEQVMFLGPLCMHH